MSERPGDADLYEGRHEVEPPEPDIEAFKRTRDADDVTNFVTFGAESLRLCRAIRYLNQQANTGNLEEFERFNVACSIRSLERELFILLQYGTIQPNQTRQEEATQCGES